MRALTRLGLVLMVPLVFGIAGCDCGGNNNPGDGGTDAGPMCTTDGCGASELCCESTEMCVAYDADALCEGIDRCAEGAASLDESCNPTCSECVPPPPLDPGFLATHLDMVMDIEGNRAVFSGYSPGAPPRAPYGDLVLGIWDAGSMETTWEILEGAPSEPVVNDPTGWRGGVKEPGPNVGKWTSIAKSGDSFYISYYDVDNGDLKMGIYAGDGSWASQTVDAEGDAGRYSHLELVDGVPVISYLAIVPPEAVPGKPVSKVKVATASSAMPASETDWTLTEVTSGEMACRPQLCGEGQACLEGDQTCITPTGDCGGMCGDDEACNGGSCATALPDPYIEDMPPALGLYTALEPTSTGLALVYYDRSSGNIFGARFDGTMWSEPFLIDGWARDDLAVGDSGIGASLYVDGDDAWHVSYVDGAEENLRYAMIGSDGTVMTRETVDDGSTDGTDPNPDGRHIVGDDSSIVVTPDGQIRIAYQDATVQRTMIATKMPGGGAWAIEILDDMDHTGFWVEQELDAATSFVGAWWRNETTDPPSNGTRVLLYE